MTKFQNKWSKPQSTGITERINEAIKSKGPLKPRIQTAIQRLQKQIGKLDSMLSKLKERDGKIYVTCHFIGIFCSNGASGLPHQ